ncbi:unnamed protein product [Rotaria sordida]|uniref:Uncharacterized protein n=1 Tax=Rotaria sordida TaxID=392033 RepID=A0A818U0V2_9BILA|nr:unnamed protein product [Rotaria sordida]CAF0966222.1 unnamed protein product [Rotaria sordida]CAF0985504.1 unnamed protein product [Rotaria sordida]CAF1018222.1 unnamed protein product [Rotaria sordida]CAF1019783.1 unnamed protein product [Rotaria sordida]
MSAEFPNSFYNNNTNRWMGNAYEPGQSLNLTPQVEKPCPLVPPVIVPYIYGSPIGWNAVIVGLLSCLLALVFLLTCLYYMAFRRRYMKEVSECPSPVALVEKTSASANLVTNTSQTATTTFINETGKDTKVNTLNEQTIGTSGTGEFVGMSTLVNGHTSPSRTNGLLANGNADQCELRLLQHEDH